MIKTFIFLMLLLPFISMGQTSDTTKNIIRSGFILTSGAKYQLITIRKNPDTVKAVFAIALKPDFSDTRVRLISGYIAYMGQTATYLDRNKKKIDSNYLILVGDWMAVNSN